MKTLTTRATKPTEAVVHINGDTDPDAGIVITPPNMLEAAFLIEGTSPLCVNRFSEKARQIMVDTQEAGEAARNKKKRAPKDFEMLWQLARYKSNEGWDGVNACSFRNGCISSCRVAGFKMVLAKLSIFCVADGYDKTDSTPLVRIIKGEPSRVDMPARNANGGMDIRPRPVWKPGWRMRVRMRFDGDQFTVQDVTNLMARMGEQNGIGEGRPFSRESYGIGYGLFKIINPND